MSENILTMDCGDGYKRADVGALFGDPSPIDKTSDYTIPDLLTRGRVYTNRGAEAAVAFTVPAPKKGSMLAFLKIVPDQNLVIQMPSGVKINNGTAGQVLKNVTDETSAAKWAVCVIVGISDTEYIVWSKTGTWANAAS